jgi:pimeloyl-ACP methyl ester carboxylesterase
MSTRSIPHPLCLIASLFILLPAVAGCSGAPSTATSVPPTGTPPLPADTPLPPTSTPLSALAPTATSLPPTEVPTPTPSSTPVSTTTPTAAPDIPSQEVSFLTADGIDLAGTLFGTGEIAVMFLHQGRGSVTQNSWKPFARLAAEQGFTALTFDFRGRGKSGGSVHESSLPIDARAAAGFLRERGYTRLVCIGAGMWGGWPCTLLALEGSLEGFAILSSPMSVGPTGSVGVAELAALTVPKLYVYGDKDHESVPENMAEVYRVSAQPKEQVVYDTSARGTNLFRSPYADDLTQKLLGFLEGIRSP